MKILLLCAGLAALAACSGTKPPGPAGTAPGTPVWFKVDPQTAGVVTGRVLFAGKKPVRKKVDMDEEPQCAKLHESAVFDDLIAAESDGALANVFVYVKQGLEDKKFEPPADPVVIDQKGCWFGPRVIGIQAGQTLKVTNSDPLTHNIHPLAQVNRDWNQSQAPGAEPLTRRFTQPEVMIRVKCNIHSWMHAWVGVVAHPYFAVTGKDGSFQLRDVPPGTYTVEAWQEELGRLDQQVSLAPAGKGEIVFRFKGE
ncbi:MAG TPA: carboxypeptidase regulatory-like domain-containing protein [Blastocatellia bacterium]|nr:carboxypeptidase regulatory-like domain-containing protein [Blastocatellia bacterium]